MIRRYTYDQVKQAYELGKNDGTAGDFCEMMFSWDEELTEK